MVIPVSAKGCAVTTENGPKQDPITTGVKLGELLVKRKIISASELKWALEQQLHLNATSKRKFRLGEVLLFAKLINTQQLSELLLEQKPRTDKDKSQLEAFKARSSLITSISSIQKETKKDESSEERSFAMFAKKLKDFFSKS